jgi:hypothetical protein
MIIQCFLSNILMEINFIPPFPSPSKNSKRDKEDRNFFIKMFIKKSINKIQKFVLPLTWNHRVLYLESHIIIIDAIISMVLCLN